MSKACKKVKKDVIMTLSEFLRLESGFKTLLGCRL